MWCGFLHSNHIGPKYQFNSKGLNLISFASFWSDSKFPLVLIQWAKPKLTAAPLIPCKHVAWQDNYLLFLEQTTTAALLQQLKATKRRCSVHKAIEPRWCQFKSSTVLKYKAPPFTGHGNSSPRCATWQSSAHIDVSFQGLFSYGGVLRTIDLPSLIHRVFNIYNTVWYIIIVFILVIPFRIFLGLILLRKTYSLPHPETLHAANSRLKTSSPYNNAGIPFTLDMVSGSNTSDEHHRSKLFSSWVYPTTQADRSCPRSCHKAWGFVSGSIPSDFQPVKKTLSSCCERRKSFTPPILARNNEPIDRGHEMLSAGYHSV